MGWFAFALLLAVSAYLGWRVWRDWVSPWRELEEVVAALTNKRMPRTFLISGSACARAIAIALEQLALRQEKLRSLVEEGEFGLQAIVGALPDGLLVADPQRRIRLMNRAFREAFGVEERTEESTVLEVVRDASVERLLGEALTSGNRRGAAVALPRPDGEEHHLEVIVEPMKSEAGAVILFRDVTELRKTEAIRRDFVANVSHELRTPLSILRGYLESLLENPKQPPAELLRIFEVLERHSNRLNLLVDDVLSLARLETPGVALEPTTIQPAIFLRGMMHDWERKFAAKELKAELDVPDELPPLRADEGRLQEIVYNLLDNAVKYSPAGGRIVVRAACDDDNFSLSVSDNGPGIPTRDLPRIFERFYRADKARHRDLGGTGLGLSIVKHIAQLHGGRVDAESELGGGTTIRVTLPRAIRSVATQS
jgi:two-component system, OmpR family, phosphate regulon sensor histidine kinase PhoR